MKVLIIVLFCSLSIASSDDDSTANSDVFKSKLPELQPASNDGVKPASPGGDNTASSGGDNTASSGGDNTASPDDDNTDNENTADLFDEKIKLPELKAPPHGVNTASSDNVSTASASNVILVVLIIIVIVAMVAGGVFYYKKIQQLGPSNEAPAGI